ncbi:type II toxin-antitoxin system ParD family antitoxin [Galbibacter pacificus]
MSQQIKTGKYTSASEVVKAALIIELKKERNQVL